ncbi:NAD(P)-binding protein [Lojkania enalia]|uniref:NAD(P)-binding protein n=1 Tax=Lojkania enalia TaxID=147567 RepID=A0A9P4TRU0_9PLEO|nr:NAD(P)-binding protein [Didymosphaeria enalia]
MAGELVLITGATGHLGYRVLVDALKTGYRVRAAVRNHAKAAKILSAPSLKSINPGSNLQFVDVPDMLAPGAYDEAIKGATYVIHIASPLPAELKEGDDPEKVLINPAVQGTLNILEAAKKAGTVKRVVITSSIVAIMPLEQIASPDPDIVIDETSRTELAAPPYANNLAAYCASKVKAFNDTEEWVKREKPGFDVINIHPSFIIGANELATTPEEAFMGTNSLALGLLVGKDIGSVPGGSNHLLDTALAHVKALDSKVPGNTSYIVSAAAHQWESAWEIFEREFPEAAKSGNFTKGNVVTTPMRFDTKKSEEILGMKYMGYEEQVKHVVSHYLTLL